MRVTRLFHEFFENAKGGVLLIVCTIISLLVANSSIQESYQNLWQYQIVELSIENWINEGLMAIFFLLIGLELKREIYVGELSNLKNALLPVFAAVGGMVIPAAIFAFFNYGTVTQSGAGIPMATDIAFAIGILSLLGNRVPASLKILLTAIAVIDDLGAILVIAVFYTTSLSLINLLVVLVVFGILLFLSRLKMNHLIFYFIGGIAMWYFMLHSGVHATLAGILLAFALPFDGGKKTSLSYKIENWLHKPVAFIILPLFALANTAIVFGTGWDTGLAEPGSLGIFAGLIIGKPLGVFLFSFLAVSIGVCTLPLGLKWNQVLGIGFLAGIGFTMSIFITLLAYDEPLLITESKISILLASLISGIIGFLWLRNSLKKPQPISITGTKNIY
ncbi:MAG TPA: Na+/H+ antiporter NhaA [Hanamia sp.]|jgi:Na+/H+ antiporter NhaA|nr:Na+/H+ antiporter NhaA [Hanamia sp.]